MKTASFAFYSFYTFKVRAMQMINTPLFYVTNRIYELPLIFRHSHNSGS